MRSKRQIITIDDERCNGCGACAPSCAEGALQIINGKARLVKESYCDGLGACLGECPQGALAIVELEADAYDEAQVLAYLHSIDPHVADDHAIRAGSQAPVPIPLRPAAAGPIPNGCGAISPCPSISVAQWEDADEPALARERQRSQLRQWPVQLHLLPVQAPFFEGADLILVADCVPLAYANFHADFVRGHVVAIGCPKLDDASAYVDKVTQILIHSDISSLKVAYMEVPCCGGLVEIARKALANSGKKIPFESAIIGIAG